MTDVQAVPPPLHAAIAGMVATRYSGDLTQRDLDVANVAAAAERERIRRPVDDLLKLLNAVTNYGFSHDHHPSAVWESFSERQEAIERRLADLLEGDTDGQ